MAINNFGETITHTHSLTPSHSHTHTVEIGDFNHRVCGAGYLRELQILETMVSFLHPSHPHPLTTLTPSQTSEMEQDISQLHILNR